METSSKIGTFRAFRNRNYALFFVGQSTSQIGTWMQRTAVSWVVYTITHSAFMLGLTVFASQAPSFVFSLYGGIVSDRYPRRRILIATQAAAMIQAILLAALVLSGHNEVWAILSLSVLLGIINAFDVPARQPLVHELVSDKADLPNAMALNSSMVNIARLVGPALSGIVLQKFGAGICFLLNAVSFVAVLISLLVMKLPPFKPSAIRKKASSELAEGIKYMANTPAIGMVILMLAIVCFIVLPYDTLLPVFAKVVFHGNAATFGYIYSFIGLGAIGGTIFLASLKPGTNLKIILLASTVILGACLMLFSHISYFPLAMFFTVLIGFGTMAQNTICLTIIQVETAAAMRGRVMGWVAMAFFGMMPLGSLLIGAVSQQIGAPTTILAQGIMAIIIAAAFSKFLRQEKLSDEEKGQMREAETTMVEKV